MRSMLFVLTAVLLLVGCVPTFGGVLRNEVCYARWPANSFPISVVVDSRLTPARQVAVQNAVIRWNAEVGFTVFTVDRIIDVMDTEWLHPHPGTVYIDQWDIEDRGLTVLAGQAVLVYVPGTCSVHHAFVSIDTAAPNEFADLIMAHELGHALGLSHDEWQPSLMYPYYDTSGNRILDDDISYIEWQAQQ